MSYYQERKDIPEKEQWDLSAIFSSTTEWEETFKKTEQQIAKLAGYEGHIDSPKELMEFLELKESISRAYTILYVYTMLLVDKDTRVTDSQALMERVDYLGTTFGKAISFFTPFILSMSESWLHECISTEKGLTYFEEGLFEIFRYKEHVLTKEQEAVVSQLSDSLSVPRNTYDMINNTDMVFGKVTTETGERIPLTLSLYAKLIEDEKREVRKEAYEAYYKPYLQMKNTIATTLAGAIKNNVATSKLRKYPSVLEKALFGDKIPTDVYENLIAATRNNLDAIREYNLFRKEKMGVKDLQPYDLSVPLVKGVKQHIPYDEAYETMLEGLAPLGPEYIHLLREFKEKRMIDVHETAGKGSGAYNIGVYGIQPYVKLNHHDDLDSMFTLAHELGHAAHSYYSNEYQPYSKSHYSIFVAEVASTVNEVLLIRHLINKTEDKDMKAYLLNHFIDQFKGTFFTQVMFAEFEKRTHEKAENSEPLNVDEFSKIYEELFREYNGNTLVITEQMKYGWARIPHFYRPFYVYKYATGYASAVDIADRLLRGEEGALENYLEFLKSGDSDYPLELLRKTGVDLETPEPIDNAMQVFRGLVEEFKTLV